MNYLVITSNLLNILVGSATFVYTIKSIGKTLLPTWVLMQIRRMRKSPEPVCYHLSYSQNGEDMVLQELFVYQSTGFYVDIGAYHPRRFSNTYFYYQKGWSGINVDATPGRMEAFRKDRPRDINLEIAIGRSCETRTLFEFTEPALNTLDPVVAQQRLHEQHPIVCERRIETQTLAKILETHLPSGQLIDFMSIDVEGLDLDVLQSNDWQMYRPRYLLVESGGFDPECPYEDIIHQYVSSLSYKLFARTLRTSIYQDVQEPPGIW
jgi:FkbM family methyltransferase